MLKKLSVLAGTAALAMSLMLLSGCGGDTVPTGGNGETTGSADETTTTASLTGATDPADTTEEETTTTSGDSADTTAAPTTTTTTEAVETTPPTTGTQATAPSGGKGAEVAALAKTLEGASFEMGAAGPNSFDNSGLIYYCFTEKGVSVPRFTRDMYQGGTAVDQNDLQPGDVLFFWMENEGTAEYAGIYLGEDEFVAANNPDDPTSIQNLSWPYFNQRFVGARRY